ncbi:MotA/TolQ/ExbB proton channel family protein [Methylotuvimicrobium sp. KM2]|uniref:MotA/TolQ/ExbB proton channel family protein n=1 Tax=Methylotuvimicrobium sp. KM2 TaxID=3133976 RepID=UPI00310178D9
MNFSETAIVDGTLYTLGFFSLLTWSVILLKAGEIAWHRYRNRQLIKSLTGDVSLKSVSSLAKQQRKPLAIQAGRVLTVGHQTYVRAQSQPSYQKTDHAAWHELIERTLRQQLQKEKALLDSGLGWLASIGSTSPFIGLFGTVWGIMHALKDIGVQGSASLEVVAGPIGEALIATALGIAVAIPAVIGYNFFLRRNRQLLAGLEHIATDFMRSCIETDLVATQSQRQTQEV